MGGEKSPLRFNPPRFEDTPGSNRLPFQRLLGAYSGAGG